MPETLRRNTVMDDQVDKILWDIGTKVQRSRPGARKRCLRRAHSQARRKFETAIRNTMDRRRETYFGPRSRSHDIYYARVAMNERVANLQQNLSLRYREDPEPVIDIGKTLSVYAALICFGSTLALHPSAAPRQAEASRAPETAVVSSNAPKPRQVKTRTPETTIISPERTPASEAPHVNITDANRHALQDGLPVIDLEGRASPSLSRESRVPETLGVSAGVAPSEPGRTRPVRRDYRYRREAPRPALTARRALPLPIPPLPPIPEELRSLVKPRVDRISETADSE